MLAGPLPAHANQGTVISSLTLSADTTWTTAGSPYWVQNRLTVGAGVRLTIEPGVVVKIGNPADAFGRIDVKGQLVARGTPAAPIVITSHRDDSVAGDTNGDGGATAPARGDWYHIYFTTDATVQSVIDRSVIQYGGSGSGGVCGPYAELKLASSASLSLTNSDLLQSQYAGVHIASGAGEVRIANNKFYESYCGVSGPSGTVTENVFESTLSRYSAAFLGSTAVKFYDNYAAKPVYGGSSPGSTREQLDLRGNSLIGGVKDEPSNQDPQDLAHNWWGHILEDPPTGCWDSKETYIPAVTYALIDGNSCAAQWKQTITGYFTKVLPALAEAPPMPSAGVSGAGTYAGSVSDGQLYGPDGGSEFAAAPSGSMADPVNTATGAFTHAETDLGMASVTGNLSVNRFYTSADSAEGPFGKGWSLGYDIRLAVAAGEAVLKAGTGQRVLFTENSDGTYTPPPGGTASLVRNQDGTFTAVTRSGLAHVFDASGRLTALTDSSGRGPSYAYDAGGRLTTVTDGGRWIAFTWDTTAGRITRAQTSAGQATTYSYTAGLLTGATDAAGGTTVYAYDAGGRLAEITSPTGRTVVRTAYDTSTGRVAEQWDGLGHRSAFAWDPATSTATMADPRGGVWKDVYAGNVLQRRVDPTGRRTDYQYDAQLRLSATYAADGTRTAFAYSPAGDLKTFQGGTGTVRSEYNAAHLPTTTVNARGHTSTRGYDAAGNVTSATDSLGNVSTLEYSAEGDLTRTASPLGSVQSMAYDAAGRVTAVTSPRGNAPGADPAQFTWRYEYDALGRTIKATDPAGQYESVDYDADGRVTKATDTKGRSTAYTYDSAGHLTSVQGPDSNVPPTTMAYDANGNTTSVTDSMGRTVAFGYDAANRATSVTNPLG
ncbi:DUF6531 domain-containing protein, partial [Sinomonas halotolerans]